MVDHRAVEQGRQPSPGRAWRAVILLSALSIMSMVDRFILALLVKPLRDNLGISDVRLGLLFGTAFAFFYAMAGLPIARLADRTNRVRLVVIAVMVWSICTVLSGFATSFSELLVLRAGLALGEAALFPAAQSLIYDLFAPRRRLLPTAIYTASPAVGAALAFIAGGPLVNALESTVRVGFGGGYGAWQMTFFTVGALSLALGIAFALLVREPWRSSDDAGPPGSLAKVVTMLDGRRSLFLGLFAAAGLCQLGPYAFQAWGSTLLVNRFGLATGTAGFLYGMVAASGAISGSVLMPLFIIRRHDRVGRGRSELADLPIAAIAIGTGAYVFGAWQGSLPGQLAAIMAGNFMLMGCVATVQVAVQRLAPDGIRATLMAGTLFATTVIGLGIGPVAAAALGRVTGLNSALALIAVISGLMAVTMFAMARSRLISDRTAQP